MKAFLFVLTCTLFTYSFAQDLPSATEKYYSDMHIHFDLEMIRSEKVQSIESVYYHMQNDTLRETSRRERFEFDRAGNIICERCESLSENNPKVIFEYDSLHRLVKKSVLAPSPKYYKKLRPEDIYAWKYNETGELSKVLRYKMVDRIHTANGMQYFPEKFILFECDSISYGDSLVTIYHNYLEHGSNDSIDFNPVEFDQPRKILLSFHSNGNLKKRTTFNGETPITVEDFDLYGRSIDTDSVTPKMRLFEALNFRGSLPTELNWIEVHDIEIITDNDTLLVFKSNNALPLFRPIRNGESSEETLTVDLKNRTVHFRNQTVYSHINQQGSYFSSTWHVRLLNFDLQVLEHESWTWEDDNTQFSHERQSKTEVNLSEIYSYFVYDYYENGLLKCFSHFRDGKEIMTMINEVTSF